MLARRNPETERNIPGTIEGYPVVAEVTGEIRPLGHLNLVAEAIGCLLLAFEQNEPRD